MMKHILALWLIASAALAQNIAVFSDGTNLYRSGASLTNLTVANELTAGNIIVGTNGATVAYGYGWQDLRFPLSGVELLGNQNRVNVDADENRVVFDEDCLTNLTADHVWGVAQFGHTWATNTAGSNGSPVSAHIHYVHQNFDETNCWFLRWRWQPLGGITNSAWNFTGPATNLYEYNGTAIHQLAYFTNIYLNGDESSILDWKLYLNGAAVSNAIEAIEFDIHYQIGRPTGELIPIID